MGATLTQAIPHFPALLEIVRVRATSWDSDLHGERHWRCVAGVGIRLLTEAMPSSDADPTVLFCFALLHDSRRWDDGFDPEHGPRAAEFLADLRGDHIGLSRTQAELLDFALAHHTGSGPCGNDETIGACWDADRLCLWRVGITPDPAYFSTLAGLDQAVGAWAREASLESVEPPSWDELFDVYSLLSG